MNLSSKTFSYSCSLPLRVHFYLSQGMISTVTLSLHSGNLMEWEIISEKADSDLVALICTWMEDFATHKQSKIYLPIMLPHLPAYTIRVLHALEQIPYGKTSTYQEVAIRTGSPRACRAVGSACRRNPAPLLIPCHRVLATGQGLGGYACGPEIKKHLLSFERSI